MCPVDPDTTQAWAWLAGALLLVAYLAAARYVRWRQAGQQMRTADAARIERETRQVGQPRRSDEAKAVVAERMRPMLMFKRETTYATTPSTNVNVHLLRRTVVHSVRDADYPTQRAAIVREAGAAGRADFALHGRRRANPYPRHSPLFALWAIEYEAAFGAAPGDEPEQRA
jgi:hypothetical protein